MEHRKKHNGRVRGKFLAVPPVIDLNSEKKDELLKDIFNKKPESSVVLARRVPLKISKLERVALPVLVVAAVMVGWSLAFDLYFYKTKVDIKNEAALSMMYFAEMIVKSVSYAKEDWAVFSAKTPSVNVTAGVGFIGDKIADLAELGSVKTISILERIK